MLKKYKRVLNMKKAICSAKFIIFTIFFLFYCNYSTFAEVDSILTEKELYEIAETVSLVYFQQFELQEINTNIEFDIIVAQMNNLSIKERIMCIYRNLLYKKSDSYTYNIDVFEHPLINNAGLKLFDSFFFSKKICGDEKMFYHRFKFAIDKKGKCYKLYGFGDINNDFESLYRTYLYEPKTTNEVFDIIHFYVYNVLFDRTQGEFLIIDSTNVEKYKKYYPEVSLPIIFNNDGKWEAKCNVLIYPHANGTVEIYEHNYNFNKGYRSFVFKDTFIKKYKIIDNE